MVSATRRLPGVLLQQSPTIYLCIIPGLWLLKRTTPSWRISDPEAGFQRVVKEVRAREIALAVLDQRRTFPNAIVLATDRRQFLQDGGDLLFPEDIKFLVVDGQHRLWAQKFSTFEANYACLVHMGLNEVQMAHLFLEINDNQKRVPSSLRWDLVRLVRPEDDPYSIGAAELVLQLATDLDSPLFQRIDLTGEQSEIQLKQGSLAPELRQLLAKRGPIAGLSFDEQYSLLVRFFSAIRALDPDNWGSSQQFLFKARVLRALLKLLPELVRLSGKPPGEVQEEDFSKYLKNIDLQSLDSDSIRASQGNAGIKAIYDLIRKQVLG